MRSAVPARGGAASTSCRAEPPAHAALPAPRPRPAPRAPAAGARARARAAPRPPAAAVRPDGTFDADSLDMDNVDVQEPDATVGDVMTTGALLSATPEQPLAVAASKLDKVTGLAVVDADNVVVGVVSIKDINRLRKAGVALGDVTVGEHMSKPPIVVRARARVGEAAALMLARRIHRLPVVDEAGKLIGIVSRTDIFQPLLNAKQDVFNALSVMEGGEDLRERLTASFQSMDEAEAEFKASAGAEDAWTVKYLYDGECSMCLQLVSLLKNQDAGRGLIRFVNIAALDFRPADHEGVSYEAAMETIHAIKRSGEIVRGPDALKLLYSTVGWGWFNTLASLPVISSIVEAIYQVLSKARLPLGRSFDSLLAMRRMKMTEEGVEHCVDDEEECEATW